MSSSSETRHIIRPEHFALAPQLLGLELARPSRRLLAILVDLTLVAVLVKMAGPALLALATAYAFFRFASRANAGRSTRLVVRVAGALILFLVARKGFNAARDYSTALLTGAPPTAVTASAGGARKAPAEPGLGTAVRVIALGRADDEDEARSIATELVAGLRASGMEDAEIRETLSAVAKQPEKPWMAAAVAGVLPPAPVEVPADSLALRYAAAVAAHDSAAADSLRPRVSAALARDTITALRDEVKTLRTGTAELEKQVEQASEAAEKKNEKGIVSTLTSLLNDLGLGFGWTGLYFTAFTLLWRGQTPGKRLLGVRVLRLDGKPLTLWSSFERFGGYAAGLVTGLLGFAQVFWDRNRQAIHDKISETVVVRERTSPAAPAAAPLPRVPSSVRPPFPERRAQ